MRRPALRPPWPDVRGSRLSGISRGGEPRKRGAP
jgi:hypothetical protein